MKKTVSYLPIKTDMCGDERRYSSSAWSIMRNQAQGPTMIIYPRPQKPYSELYDTETIRPNYV